MIYLEHDAPDRPVSLYVNSPGGSFGVISAIYDTLQYLTCEVETYCLGQAGSCASALLAAGAPGRRHALPGARVVVRQPELTEPMWGRPSDLEVEAQELERVRSMLTTLLARHTGRDAGQITDNIERDLILDAAGAKAYGLADHVLENRKSSLRQHAARCPPRMRPPKLPPLPALTCAEGEFIDHHLEVLDQVGRINPARGNDTYGALRAAQALVSHARAARRARVDARARGGADPRHDARPGAGALDRERRAGRVTVPPAPAS